MALAAARFKEALLGFVCDGVFGAGRRKPFTQNQENGRAENENKEKEFVANDGADEGHFLLAGRNPARFAKLMQAGDGELSSHEPEDDGGHRKKAVQRNLNGPLDEEKSDGDGGSESEKRADPGLQAVAGKLNGPENQCEFDAFAQNHEKHKKKNAPSRSGASALGIYVYFLLDILAKMARNAVHPNDHRNNEYGGDEKE